MQILSAAIMTIQQGGARLMSLLGTASIFGESGVRRQSLLYNGVRLMSVTWIETGLSAAYFAIMARLLGPTLYGSWAYGIAVYTLIIGAEIGRASCRERV